MFNKYFTLVALLVVSAACKTADKIAKVDSDRGEATLYSIDDNRSAMPDPHSYRPYSKASDNLTSEVKKNGRDVTSKLNLAQLKLIQGKYDDSEQLCKDALRLDLKNVEAKKILAQIAFRRGNLDLASIIMSSIDNHVKKDSQMLNLMALIALKKGENTEAMAHFKQALNVNGDDLAVRMNLGVLYLKYRQLPAAAVQFERVLKVMPEHQDAKLHLAIIKVTRGQAEESEKIYASILSDKDNNPLALYNIAVAQKASGKFDKALDNLKAYLKTKPSDGAETNEAFALIDDIQNEKSVAGEPVSDDEIQELAAKVSSKADEEEAPKAQPQQVQQPVAPVAPQAKQAAKPLKGAKAPVQAKKTESTGEDDEISDLEKQLK